MLPMVRYLVPPAIPSLGDCFPCFSVDIGKYLLHSSALSQNIPNALARLSDNLDARNYDSSGLGPGLDVIGETRTIFTQEISDDACDEVLKQICVGEDRV